MKKHWRTIFFFFGVAAVVLMLLTFDADWNRVKEVLSDAGIWFPVIVLLWGFIYLMNACSFGLIINDGVLLLPPLILTLVLASAYFGSRKIKKGGISPILLITLSAIAGLAVYGL